MKKLTLIFCLATIGCFLSLSSMAQGVGFGIKGGLNLSNQDLSSDGISIDTKSRAGFHGGVFLTFMFSEKIGIQPEALYSMQGSEIDFFGSTGDLKFSYISIPVLLRYNINEMFSVHAGPQLGLLMSAEADFDGDTEDLKDDVKGSDIGLAFGLEVDLPAKLGFGARYVAGLSDIAEESFGAELKNNSLIQIYIKYRLKSGE